MEVVGTVRITSLSLKGDTRSCGYILGVFTHDKIGTAYAKAIRQEWQDSIFCRKRRITIKNNEIRIQLKKGDTIQKYIDYISGIINKIKNSMKPSRRIRMKQRKIHIILKKELPSKIYYLACCKTIRKSS